MFNFLITEKNIEEMESVLTTATGSEKIEILNELSILYKQIDPEKSLEHARSALKLASEQNDQKQKAQSLNNIGTAYDNLKNYDSALNNFRKAVNISLELDDKRNAATTLDNIGVVYLKHLHKYQKALDNFNQSLQLREDIGNKIEIANSLMNIGVAYKYLNKHKNALQYHLRSLKIKEENGDSEESLATSLNYIGIAYYDLSKYDKAIEYLVNSLNLIEKTDNERLAAQTMNNIGLLYKKLNKFEKALEFYENSLDIKRRLDDDEGIANSLNSIGIIHRNLKHYYKALDYYQQALEIITELGNKQHLANALNNIAVIYLQLDGYGKALEFYRKSLEINEEINNSYGIANTLHNISEIYILQEDYDNAIITLDVGLKISKDISAYDLMKDYYNAFSILYNKKKDFQNALKYKQLHSEMIEKIFSEESGKKIAEVQGIYDIKKKEEKIDLLKKDKEILKDKTLNLENEKKILEESTALKDAEIIHLTKEQELWELKLTRQRDIIRMTIAFALFIILIVFLLYNRFRLKKKIIKQLALINDEIKKKNAELLQTKERLTQQARTDPLTNLANRRDMHERLEYEKKRFERNEESFVLVMGDIDNFKMINDTHGHEAGDLVLKTISALMKKTLRKQDIVSRWGGEEFLLYLPETDLNGGKIASDKVRKHISKTKFEYKGKIIPVTITFGVCEYDTILDINECISKADAALYKGKKNGKNQVMLAS